MSSLQKGILKSKFPGLPPKGNANGPGRTSAFSARHRDLAPAQWQQYFSSAEDVRLESGDVFHVYRAGSSGPLLVLLHGGGFSGLTWALFTERIVQSVECQVLAVDLRGHGETTTSDDTDLSAERQVSDVAAVVESVFGQPAPPAVLVGHSMGGAIAVHAAHAWSAGPLVGVIVIDVVEGTAMEALSSMHTFLRGRPDRFHSVQHAIEWCLKSGAVRNSASACVSVPGQIKNVRTGEPATRELTALPPGGDKSQMAPPAHTPAADSIAEENEDGEEEAGGESPPGAPSCSPAPAYTWRIDLASSEQHWAGWFRGLSELFLTAPAPKVLLLAGIDRLDRELAVGQMQGKFQLQVLSRSGHAVHEDTPDQVAGVVASFLVRHRLTQARDGFQPPSSQSASGLLGTLSTCGKDGDKG